jgi:hypothetical protein
MGWKRKGKERMMTMMMMIGFNDREGEGGREERREGEGRCCMLNVTVRDTARCLLRYTTQYYKDCLNDGDRFYSPSFNVHFIYFILFLY